MNFTKTEETSQQYFARLKSAVQTLTQDQIDACAWVMGGSGAGWNKENISSSLPEK
jgi:hypothetical protein